MWRIFNAFVRGARGARRRQHCKDDDFNLRQAKVQLQVPCIANKALYSTCPTFREQLCQIEWTPGTSQSQRNLIWANRRNIDLSKGKEKAQGVNSGAYLQYAQHSRCSSGGRNGSGGYGRQSGKQSCKRQQQIQFLLKHSVLQALGWGSAIALTWSVFQPLNYKDRPGAQLWTCWQEKPDDANGFRHLPKEANYQNALSSHTVSSHVNIEKGRSLFSLLYGIVLNQPVQSSILPKEKSPPNKSQEEHLATVKELFEANSRSNDSGFPQSPTSPSQDDRWVPEGVAGEESKKQEVYVEDCNEREGSKNEYERLELEKNAAIKEFKDSLQEFLLSDGLDVSALHNQLLGVVESDIGKSIVEEEPETAFHYFECGALLGDPSSTFNLGLCYHLGRGTEQNLTKARELYEAAATVNHGWATYNLAVLIGKGEGGPQDQDYAHTLLQKAAQLGVGEAKEALGRLEMEESLNVVRRTHSAPEFQELSEEHWLSSYSTSDLLTLSSEDTDEHISHSYEVMQKEEFIKARFYLPS